MATIKDDMIRIATETAQKAGIRAITMRELGEAVGIKSSSVMYHFQNKDGLLQAIVATYRTLFFSRLADMTGREKNPLKRLHRLIDLFEESLDKDKMCLCGMLASEVQELDIDTRKTTKLFFKDMEHWVGEQLEAAGIDSGLAPLVVSALEGAMLLDRLDGQHQRLRGVRRWLDTLGGG
ncbi:MAG: TetR/AcrR family transcriptional regulator [Gammaproteobacteria bacterium]